MSVLEQNHITPMTDALKQVLMITLFCVCWYLVGQVSLLLILQDHFGSFGPLFFFINYRKRLSYCMNTLLGLYLELHWMINWFVQIFCIVNIYLYLLAQSSLSHCSVLYFRPTSGIIFLFPVVHLWKFLWSRFIGGQHTQYWFVWKFCPCSWKIVLLGTQF